MDLNQVKLMIYIILEHRHGLDFKNTAFLILKCMKIIK